MYQSSNLSHRDAQEMIDLVRTTAERAGKAVCVAVADSHGELIAFLRMDGCQLPSLDISMNKAFTAARERKESGALGTHMKETGYPMTNYGSLRYVGWGGGVPVLSDGKVIGAIGVSGLSSEEDVELARAAVKLPRK
jgi:glc operon protein GlcG